MATQTPLTSDTPIVLLTGIARPKPLLEHLSKKYKQIKHFEYRDHYQYTSSDLEKMHTYIKNEGDKKVAILTTEKDYQRLAEFSDEELLSLYPLFVVEIEVTILFDEQDKFNNIIEDYVRKNRKNCRISE